MLLLLIFVNQSYHTFFNTVSNIVTVYFHFHLAFSAPEEVASVAWRSSQSGRARKRGRLTD